MMMMMMTTTTNNDSDPDFYLPSSSSSAPPPLKQHHQNPRKKRSKLIKIEPNWGPNNGSASGVSKAKYCGKKPDPSAPKITRPCTECGKKFWSWKALFGHMRCHPERQWRGINPPPNYRRPTSPIQHLDPPESAMTAEDQKVASCLVMLANSAAEDGGTTGLEAECCSRFEWSSCNKVFGSYQELGGHRASHKNVKGRFAITRSDGFEEENVEKNKNKMTMVLGHKCSICLRVFSSGQALGGHKRCHWEKGEEGSSSMNQGLNGLSANEGCSVLDLNLPAPVAGDESSSSYCSAAVTLDLRLGL